MNNILSEPFEKYLIEKNKTFKKNDLASKFRREFPKELGKAIEDKTRFKAVGSSGQGKWTECPWIAILDILLLIVLKKDITLFSFLNQSCWEFTCLLTKE